MDFALAVRRHREDEGRTVHLAPKDVQIRRHVSGPKGSAPALLAGQPREGVRCDIAIAGDKDPHRLRARGGPYVVQDIPVRSAAATECGRDPASTPLGREARPTIASRIAPAAATLPLHWTGASPPCHARSDLADAEHGAKQRNSATNVCVKNGLNDPTSVGMPHVTAENHGKRRTHAEGRPPVLRERAARPRAREAIPAKRYRWYRSIMRPPTPVR